MAAPAVCIETPTVFARYACADVAIAKGTLLQLSGDNTASASDGANIFAGIAWEEKSAGDGLTEITAAISGVWDLKDAGAGITAGGLVSLNGADLIKQAVEAEMVTGAAFGKALETAAAAEVIRVRIGLV